MYKNFEVLQIYADRFGSINNTNYIGEIQINNYEIDDFYAAVRNEMQCLEVPIPESWGITKDEHTSVIKVYDTRGNYRYQLKSY
mgnify:CR=1 FL=1